MVKLTVILLSFFFSSSMSHQEPPVSMELSGPYTDNQRELAARVMIEIYCQENEKSEIVPLNLREIFNKALTNNDLPTDIQYIPEVTKEFNKSIRDDQCI